MDPVPHPFAWLRDRPLVADALLFAVVTAIGVGIGFHADVQPGERTIGLGGWLLIVGMNAPIVLRRRAPVAAIWLVVAFLVPFWVLDYPDAPTGVALLIGLYSLGAHVPRRRSLGHFWGLLAVLTAVMLAGILSDNDGLPWLSLPANIVIMAAAWLLGDNLRTRRAYLDELEQKAATSEAQRRAEAERAINEERTRIARELHDVVAHSMSVIVVQATAARRVLGRSPHEAATALEAIENIGRESLQEMRRVLGVLRNDRDQAALTPAPGLEDLDRLLRQCEEAGLPVALEVTGEPEHLAAGLELSIFRVVQESLTNSLKHAGPAHAVVRLHYRPGMLELEVLDDGRGASAVTSEGGQGLVGMRERVEAFGGTFVTGPRPGGGFRVAATFPVGALR